jgi:glycosyltransferase involved in cell wall biosynthesis
VIPVSVAVITKNEENKIEDALDSVRDFEDIVVVDSYSDDRTAELCRRFTQRVYSHEWSGFARQKQLAVDYAKQRWVLILDADERVTPELRAEIAERIKNGQACGYYVPRKNFFLGKWIRHSGWWPDHTLRLFRKDLGYVEQREVHEKVVVNGRVDRLRSPLEHHTYETLSDFVRKTERYSDLAAKELATKSRASVLTSMAVSPLFVFFKMFFLRQGFRDGVRGFLLAALYSYYTLLKYAKAWELKRD